MLARILTPDEYGLMGIITIFIGLAGSFVDSGFSNALVRKQDATDEDYNTVFIVNLAVSVFFSLLLVFGAPLIAKFFDRPPLVALTRAMSLMVVINALSIVQGTQLSKRLDFKTQTRISITSSSVSGIVGIAMALCGCGVWSLVGQQLSRALLNSALLWGFNRWIPNFSFSKKSFTEMFSFGWKLLVSGLLCSVWGQIYQIVIGKCYSPASLGHYTRAKQFANLCSSNLTGVVQRVSYPSLSTIQDDAERLKNAYRTTIKTTMLVTFCCMFGLAAVAKPMIRVLIGSKWMPCVPMLQIVCFSLVLYPLQAINLNMLQIKGRSDLFLKLEIIKKIIGIGPLLLGVFVDIYWMLWGSVVTSIISYFLNSGYSGKLVGYSTFDQMKDIAPSLGISLFMGLVVFAMNLLPVSPFILLPLQVLSGVAMVIGICEALQLKEYREAKAIFLSVVGKSKDWVKAKI